MDEFVRALVQRSAPSFLNDDFLRRDIMADKRVQFFFGSDRLVRHIQRRLLPHVYFSDDPTPWDTSSIGTPLPLAASWCHVLPSNESQSISDPTASTCLDPAAVLEVREATFGISSVIWDASLGLLILGSADFSFLSRLDSYLTNIRLPWEPAHVPIPMGRVSFWKFHSGRIKRTSALPTPSNPFPLLTSSFKSFSSSQILDPLLSTSQELALRPLPIRRDDSTHQQTTLKDSPRFELLEFLDLQSQVTSLCFDSHQGHLFASLSNGKVEYFTVRTSDSPPIDFLPFDIPSSDNHNGRQGDLFVRRSPQGDPPSEEKTFRDGGRFPELSVTYQSSSSLGYLLPHHSDALTCLIYDHTRYLLFSGSTDSSLKVYDFG